MSAAVGVVGFGEAGSVIAGGLAGAGARVVAYDARFEEPGGDALRGRAGDAGVGTAADLGELVGTSDVLLSLVTAESALAVAGALAARLEPRHLVADLNSTSPELARRIAETVDATGAAFTDVAVMAAVPGNGHHVPMLASGAGAARFAGLGFGLRVEVVPGGPGAASAVKMLRSLLVKGLEALFLEFAVAAHPYGAGDRALASLQDSLPAGDWSDLATYLLGRTARHAARRGQELDQVASMLRELDVEPWLAHAGARRLEWAARQGLQERFADAEPGHFDDVAAAALEGRP